MSAELPQISRDAATDEVAELTIRINDARDAYYERNTLLVAAGYAAFTWPVLAACLLITLGAVIAAKDMLFKRAPATAT